MNIYDLLEERGIIDGDHTRIESYLPIEAFDDLEFESLTPEQWIKKGSNAQGQCSLPGMAFRSEGGDYGWSEVRCTSFDEASQMYTVQYCDTGGQDMVSRLNLLFFAEDPRVFADRIAAAPAAAAPRRSHRRHTPPH